MANCLTENEINKTIQVIINNLNTAFAVILISFGLFGNLFSLYIYTSKCFRRTSTGFYFSCLSIVNTLGLIIYVIRFFHKGISKEDISNLSDFNCKFFDTSIYFFATLSAWIETVASLDRLTACKFSPFYTKIKTRKFNVLTVGLIVIIIVCINVPNFIFFELVQSGTYLDCKVCGIKTTSSYDMKTLDYIDLVASVLVPFLLMIFSSFKISRKLFNSKLKVVNIKNSKLNFGKEYQFSALIIGRNVFFLLSNLPAAILLIIDINCNLYSSLALNNEYSLAYMMTSFLSYFNHANSFCIDFLCNRMFRKRFIQIFRKKYIMNETIKL